MSHGTEITKEQAQKFIDQQLKITRKNRALVSASCTSRGDNEAANYYLANTSGNPINCFIFEEKFVRNFLTNGATHLLVFLGASPGIDNDVNPGDDPSAGQPTVVLVGCTMSMEGGSEVYRSLAALKDKPAVEHPPLFYIPITTAPGAGDPEAGIHTMALNTYNDILTFIPTDR